MTMRLLDLFSGGGGAAMGYHHAGFEVVGIDNQPQRSAASTSAPARFACASILLYMTRCANWLAGSACRSPRLA